VHSSNRVPLPVEVATNIATHVTLDAVSPREIEMLTLAASSYSGKRITIEQLLPDSFINNDRSISAALNHRSAGPWVRRRSARPAAARTQQPRHG